MYTYSSEIGTENCVVNQQYEYICMHNLNEATYSSKFSIH